MYLYLYVYLLHIELVGFWSWTSQIRILYQNPSLTRVKTRCVWMHFIYEKAFLNRWQSGLILLFCEFLSVLGESPKVVVEW